MLLISTSLWIRSNFDSNSSITGLKNDEIKDSSRTKYRFRRYPAKNFVISWWWFLRLSQCVTCQSRKCASPDFTFAQGYISGWDTTYKLLSHTERCNFEWIRDLARTHDLIYILIYIFNNEMITDRVSPLVVKLDLFRVKVKGQRSRAKGQRSRATSGSFFVLTLSGSFFVLTTSGSFFVLTTSGSFFVLTTSCSFFVLIFFRVDPFRIFFRGGHSLAYFVNVHEREGALLWRVMRQLIDKCPQNEKGVYE